jgi:hypothetical protein
MIAGIDLLTSAVINGAPAVEPFLGKVVYVNSNADGGTYNTGSIKSPCLTLASALTIVGQQVGDNLNDVIVLMPGHSEAISTATALNISRAGVQIVGIGAGARRPQLRLTTVVGATVTVSAESVRLVNVRITAAFADITTGITLTTAKNFTMVGCVMDAEETDENYVDFIKTSTTDNAADGLTLIGNRFVDVDTANDNVVNIRGHLDGLRVEKNFFRAGVANGEGIIEAQSGKNCTNLLIRKNTFVRYNTATAGFATLLPGTGNTGMIVDNRVVASGAIAVLLVAFSDGGTGIVGLAQNYVAGETGKSGLLTPAVDAD